jgi:hypothetical protein
MKKETVVVTFAPFFKGLPENVACEPSILSDFASVANPNVPDTGERFDVHFCPFDQDLLDPRKHSREGYRFPNIDELGCLLPAMTSLTPYGQGMVVGGRCQQGHYVSRWDQHGQLVYRLPVEDILNLAQVRPNYPIFIVLVLK